MVELWLVDFSAANATTRKIDLGEEDFRDYLRGKDLSWSTIFGTRDFLIQEVLFDSESAISVTGRAEIKK